MFEFSFINGFILGFEVVFAEDLEESDGTSDYLVIDLFIVRLLFTYIKE
jgi:regulator of RNase E activity RraB